MAALPKTFPTTHDGTCPCKDPIAFHSDRWCEAGWREAHPELFDSPKLIECSDLLNSDSWAAANARLFGDDPLMSREMLSALLDQAILLSTFIVEFHVPASPERETAVRMMKELLARRQG